MKRAIFLVAVAALLASATSAFAFTGVKHGTYKTYTGDEPKPPADRTETIWGLDFTLNAKGTEIDHMEYYAMSECTDETGQVHQNAPRGFYERELFGRQRLIKNGRFAFRQFNFVLT